MAPWYQLEGRGIGCAGHRADTVGRALPWGSSSASTPSTSPGTAATFREREECGTTGVGRQGVGTNRLKCGAKKERKKQVCPRPPHGVTTGLPTAGDGVRQPFWAGRTHHWLSRGRAGSILSPTKGPGSVVSVFVLLRLLEPCLRAALAFSSLQGEVRPYPSPSDGPAKQTRITGRDPHFLRQEVSEPLTSRWVPSHCPIPLL